MFEILVNFVLRSRGPLCRFTEKHSSNMQGLNGVANKYREIDERHKAYFILVTINIINKIDNQLFHSTFGLASTTFSMR